MTRYAFTLDSSACSGCKACQVACKDKHDLPVGVLWRRVYEVTGGGWEQRGGAWLNDVFAYNVSMACNHCERPICREVCPTAAIGRRDDGIVLIDADRCMGCRYCEWACPYGALQYHEGPGQMTKCTFCADELDAGRPPACVAACPLRVLGFETVDATDERAGDAARGTTKAPGPDSGAAVFPMPDPALTRPAFRVIPHPGASNGGSERAARVANGEEVARSGPGLREPSLVAFTLLAQTAAGMLWALLAGRWLADPGGTLVGSGTTTTVSLTAILVAALAAMAFSFLHLGRPRNAWRAPLNLRSSWLSREVLCVALFTAGTAVLLVLHGTGTAPVPAPGAAPTPGGGGPAAFDLVAAATAAAGLAMVYSMARVYRLRTVPAWDTARTTIGFLATALVLGALVLILVGEVARLASAGSRPAGGVPAGTLAVAAAALVAAVAAVRARTRFYASHRRVGV